MFLAILQLSHSVEMGELKKDVAVARVKVVSHPIVFIFISSSHSIFFFNCFVLLTSAQAKYERDLEIVVKETNTERDIVMKKVSYVVFCPFCILLSSVCYVFLA